MNTAAHANVDQHEVAKFEEIAYRWWDTESEFKPLHDINPLRLNYIDRHAQISGKKVLDVGCGGGILSESMAARAAQVTGIDMGATPLEVARLHLLESGLSVDYQQITVEEFAERHAGEFDVVTCMEMLEHVPDPESVVRACIKLIKPGGKVFLSTLNRNPKAYALAILGAEYLMGMLPKGTHDYKKFIKPSELGGWMRRNGLTIADLSGMSYNPLSKNYSLGKDIDVNYLTYGIKETD
ncbi:MAG: bifunctional 2-polyprenyl-6-hydroxyphenol methylase/3-demethylubiquinol 3-O-methyltransferase UbiG [Gammaproteobacteria bacterium]|nr:bifunctional 2-polyprenyl-6-hydroxyphenol methylase/3-demethylubiquinol 3-O-methyltransferase UbiG [Gammaproteobacteria bacterium]